MEQAIRAHYPSKEGISIKRYLLLLTILISINITNCYSVTHAASVNYKPSLTLIQAIHLGYPSAREWDNHALLLSAINIDLENNPCSGSDGRRNNWNIEFGVPDCNKLFLVTIHDGKVDGKNDLTDKKQPATHRQEFINLPDVNYDSPQLLKRAKAIAPIYPGKNWAKGYSFRILMDTEKKTPVIFVIGWDQAQKHMKSVLFNADTGEPIPINN